MSKIFLKDIAVSQTGPFGTQLHESDYVKEGTPIVTVEHLGENTFTHQNLPLVTEEDVNRLKKYILKEGDIVFSRVGSVERSTYVTNKENGWLFSGRCLRVRVDEAKACSKYISYYFRQKKFKEMMLNISVGATMPSLNTTLMDNIPLVGLPNLSTQKQVALVLSFLDDKIELNNRINQELDGMAKLLYDYWFVQFDFPNENGKPYKSSGGKMVYNKVLKREVPEGWEVNAFKGLLNFTRGVSYTSNTVNETLGIPMINLKSFNLNGTYRKDGIKYFTGKLNESRIISKDDLLIAITDVTREAEIIGRAISTPEFNSKVVCSCDVARVDIIDDSFQKHYLRFLFNSNYFHNYIKHYASGTLVLHLDLNGINWYKDTIPPIKLQEQFQNFVSNTENKIQENAKQNQKLAELRDWLLPMLMNGQVKVGEVYKEVEEGLSVAAEGEVGYGG